MSRGVILAADGVDDTQFEYVRHRLREDGMLVDIVSPCGGPLRGRRGLRVPDSMAVEETVGTDRYDVAVLPGGEWVDSLDYDGAVRPWLRAHVEQNTVLAAIMDGVDVLERMGLLVGYRASGSRPADANTDSLEGVEWTDELVTVDGTLVTANDPEALPYLVAAALDNVVLRQPTDDELVERPAWE